MRLLLNFLFIFKYDHYSFAKIYYKQYYYYDYNV